MSTILVDNLTGKTSAGDITVTSEGGAATQSLQQGLAKAWINFIGTGTVSIRGSLNVSSLDDTGSGIYDYNLTNAMAGTKTWSVVSGAGISGNYTAVKTHANGTDNPSINTSIPTGGWTDSADVQSVVNGDLA
jgi:hypothetical protein